VTSNAWTIGCQQGIDDLNDSDDTWRKEIVFGLFRLALYPVYGKLHGKFSRKLSEIAVVILISFVAARACNFPCCKPDEGNRVIEVVSAFVRSAWSHIPTKNDSFIALWVFALDAEFSMYGRELRVYGHELRASELLDAIKLGPLAIVPTKQSSAEFRRW
jgi:hypothetical protein